MVPFYRLLKFLTALTVISGTSWYAISLLVFENVLEEPYPIVKPINITEMLSPDHQNCVKEVLEPRRKFRNPIYEVILDFNRAMTDVGLGTILVEPSILYCMLNMEYKSLLFKRGFNLTSLLGAPNIINFAVNHLTEYNYTAAERRLHEYGFRHYPVFTEAIDWLSDQTTNTVPTHYYFVRKKIAVHLVIFFKRGNYLWHAALDRIPQEITGIISPDVLLYSETNSAYDRFVGFEIATSSGTEPKLAIPSEPVHFLWQISTSAFLECESSRYSSYKVTKEEISSEVRLKKAIVRTLIELKSHAHPLLLNIFLFSGTLLGWYRDCGVIPYTSDIDYATWAVEIRTINKLFDALKYSRGLKLIRIFGLPEEAYELRFTFGEVPVDLFFVYEDKENGTFYTAGHRPSKGYYFRYKFPRFTICSADLFGEKVQVPCESEAVLSAEYGPDWYKPVKNWNYEYSPFNLGPKIMWTKVQKAKMHTNFKTT